MGGYAVAAASTALSPATPASTPRPSPVAPVQDRKGVGTAAKGVKGTRDGLDPSALAVLMESQENESGGAASREGEGEDASGLGLGFGVLSGTDFGGGSEQESRRYTTDLGNLMVVDSFPIPGLAEDTSARDTQLLALATGAVQHLVSQLFSLPSSAIKEGRLVSLPAPSTTLPREKPIPKPQPPTKWEKFAQAKGIQKRKRSKVVFDEAVGDWKRRHGYGRANDERQVPIIEAKDSDEVGVDAFAKLQEDKASRVKKQEKNQLANLKKASKAMSSPRPGIPSPIPASLQVPSTLTLSATSLPLMPAGMPPKIGSKRRRLSKDEIAEAASLAGRATASLGKFDSKQKGAKAPKKSPKAMKVLPVAEPGSGKRKGSKGGGGGENGSHGPRVERQFMQSLADAVIAKNDTGPLDVGKAVNMLNREEGGRKRGRDSGAKGSKAKKGKKQFSKKH